MYRLSILIPTLNEPFNVQMLRRLNSAIDPQIAKYPGQIEKYINDKGRSISTGAKRNQMIRDTDSDYFVFIDDDDIIHPMYVDRLMEGINKGVDVITFCGEMHTRHRPGSPVVSKVDFIIKLGESYEERDGKYYRFPNHLSCIRRDLVHHIKFPDKTKGEDYPWAKMIHDKRLLKTEHHIQEKIYTYDYVINK